MRDKLLSVNEDIQDLCRKLKQGELDIDVFQLAPEEFMNLTIDLSNRITPITIAAFCSSPFPLGVWVEEPNYSIKSTSLPWVWLKFG